METEDDGLEQRVVSIAKSRQRNKWDDKMPSGSHDNRGRREMADRTVVGVMKLRSCGKREVGGFSRVVVVASTAIVVVVMAVVIVGAGVIVCRGVGNLGDVRMHMGMTAGVAGNGMQTAVSEQRNGCIDSKGEPTGEFLSSWRHEPGQTREISSSNRVRSILDWVKRGVNLLKQVSR